VDDRDDLGANLPQQSIDGVKWQQRVDHRAHGCTAVAEDVARVSGDAGEADLFGFRLQNTEVGFADEVAAAASMVMGQAAEAAPAVIVRGLSYTPAEGSALELARAKEKDMFR